MADAPSAPGRDLDYEVTDKGWVFLAALGLELRPGRRPLVRYRVDWSEQRHHLGGRLGRGLLDLSLDRGWVRRRDTHRAVVVTDAGADAFAEHFGVTAGP